MRLRAKRVAEQRAAEHAENSVPTAHFLPVTNDAQRVLEACGRPESDTVIPIYDKLHNGAVRRMTYRARQVMMLEFIPAAPEAHQTDTAAPFPPGVRAPAYAAPDTVWRFQSAHMQNREFVTSKHFDIYLPAQSALWLTSYNSMRILVIGAGAVGGYFGARLQAAGRDVTFLVREKRAEQLRRGGLHVISPFGDVSVQPYLLSAEELRASPQTFGLILVSTKAYSLDAAMDDFAPAIGQETAILPLLNGMRHLDTLVARFGAEHVLGGSTRIVADLDSEGRVHHLEHLHDLVFGEFHRADTPRIQAIAATLHGAGFEDELSPDIVSFMWKKWVLLASLGSITCLMRGSIGQVAAAPGGPETARAIIAECAAIAAAEGNVQTPEFLSSITTRLTKTESSLTASMYRDLHKGQPVEADQIVGDLLARAAKHGINAALLRATYAQLSVYSRALTG